MRDGHLIQIVDAALAEAGRKAGAWLACRPGCCECCLGPFPITPLDALRLRGGLAGLAARDPARAARVLRRARESVERLTRDYPGDTVARLLDEDAAGEREPCPALDPGAGTCDLYQHRPITCRTFGPPLHFAGESPGVCELCFVGATPEQIAACAVQIDSAIEAELTEPFADRPVTIVAFALADPGYAVPKFAADLPSVK